MKCGVAAILQMNLIREAYRVGDYIEAVEARK